MATSFSAGTLAVIPEKIADKSTLLMISRLSLVEIQKLLRENVEIGDPNSKGLPRVISDEMEENKHVLYGTLENVNFALTFNSTENVCPYILKGTLISKGQTQTEVNYRVRIMPVPKILFIIIFVIIHIWAYFIISEELLIVIISSTFYLTFWTIFIVNLKKSKSKLNELEEYFKSLVQIKR